MPIRRNKEEDTGTSPIALARTQQHTPKPARHVSTAAKKSQASTIFRHLGPQASSCCKDPNHYERPIGVRDTNIHRETRLHACMLVFFHACHAQECVLTHGEFLVPNANKLILTHVEIHGNLWFPTRKIILTHVECSGIPFKKLFEVHVFWIGNQLFPMCTSSL